MKTYSIEHNGETILSDLSKEDIFKMKSLLENIVESNTWTKGSAILSSNDFFSVKQNPSTDQESS